jgi:hypothetical protein
MNRPRRETAAGEPTPTRASSWRAILIGCVLLPLNAWWLVHMEMGSSGSLRATSGLGPYPTNISLFANVIFWLAALMAVNGLLRRVAPPRIVLRADELLLIYVMLSIGTCLTSIDFLDVLFPMLGHPARYASPANGWQDLFVRFIPRGFAVTDAEGLAGWYLGSADPLAPRHLAAWLPSLLTWGVFILVLLFVMLCLVTLLRVPWTQYEKHSYPIIEMPLEMTDPSRGFFRQPLLWGGFACSGGLCLLNGLSVLYPSLPALPVKGQDISVFFTESPWNAMGFTPVAFYPFAIGMGFLLPTDMLFSSWFFCLMWRAQRVVSRYYGWSSQSPNAPYVNEQSFGAYMAVAALALWSLRPHLKRIWEGASAEAARPGRKEEGFLSPRAAIVGAASGILFLVAFFWQAGLPLWAAALAFVIYFGIALACTRMRAELGPPAHDLHNGGPDYVLTAVFGSRAFSPQALTALTWFYWFNRAYRTIAMPYQLEAYKIGDRRGITPRVITGALFWASVVGLISGCAAHYAHGYLYGAESRMAGHYTGFGWEAFNRLGNWVQAPKGTDVPAAMAILAGLCATLLLHVARLRFLWWPFHPLGLAVSGSFSMSTLWVPMLIAWVFKVNILRYGGLRGYRTVLPFFLGLILGDFLVGSAWSLIGWAIGVNTYSFYF